MAALNTINWQAASVYLALGNIELPEVKTLADFESIQVGFAIKRAKGAKNTSKRLDLVGIGVKANTYSMINVDMKGRLKVLYRVFANDRRMRQRPDQNQKADDV